MSFNKYCSALLAVAAVALLAVPPPRTAPPPLPAPPPPAPPQTWRRHCPPADLLLSAVLLAVTVLVYLAEWIQRKLVERRIIKMQARLSQSADKLRAWERQQQQLEGALQLVQAATAEYQLLLTLLLRAAATDKNFHETLIACSP